MKSLGLVVKCTRLDSFNRSSFSIVQPSTTIIPALPGCFSLVGYNVTRKTQRTCRSSRREIIFCLFTIIDKLVTSNLNKVVALVF